MQDESADLAGLLNVWASGTGPLYDQLALAIVRLAESGDLVAGTRLPPERELAKALAVSRTTIISAYAKLQELGWLTRRQGAGTWISRPREDPRLLIQADDGRTSYAVTRVLDAAVAPGPGVIDLATAAFKDGHHLHEVLSGLTPQDVVGYGELGGYHPLGIPELRAAVADYLSHRDIPTTLDQVIITTGVQQAVHIVFSVLAPAGHPVAVESPTWNCVLDILRMLGAVVVPMPVDEGGVRLDEISARTHSTNIRAVWMTSGYHNPTGVEVLEARVRHAARLTAATQIPIVEDISVRDLGLGDHEPPPTVAQCAPTAPVITVGSLSKLLSPALRLGYLRAQPDVVRQLARQKTVWDNGVSLLSQVVALRLLADWRSLTDERRRSSAANCAIATEAIRRALPDWGFRPPDGGLSLWVTIPDMDPRRFAQLAIRERVEILPGTIFHWGELPTSSIRISLARSREDTEEGIRRLVRAWPRN
jgi:DNA-binding transcriptional MocR family regulator